MQSRPPVLRLLGELDPETNAGGGWQMEASYSFPLIHGINGADGQAVTVFQTGGTVVPAVSMSYFKPHQTLTVRGAIVLGAHLDDEVSSQIIETSAQLSGLDHWIGVGTYATDQLDGTAEDEDGYRWPVVTQKAGFGPVEVDRTLSIRTVATYHRESMHDARGTVYEIRDNAVAIFAYREPQPLATTLEDIRILMDLVTFFSGAPSWLQSREIVLSVRPAERLRVLDVGHKIAELPTLGELKDRSLLYSSEMHIEDVVQRWFAFNRGVGRSAINVLHASHYKDGQYTETEFLNAMTALEALYSALSPTYQTMLPTKINKFAPKASAQPGSKPTVPKLRDPFLGEQLDALLSWVGVDQFSRVVPAEKQQAWVALAVKARNDLVHEGHFKTRLSTSGLGALTRGVRWLLNLALMKHLGIGDASLRGSVWRSREGQAATFTTARYLADALD